MVCVCPHPHPAEQPCVAAICIEVVDHQQIISLRDATLRSDYHTENCREWRCTTGQPAHHRPVLSEGVALEYLFDVLWS